MSSAPTIETEHLILRPFTPDDAGAYYKAVLSQPGVMRALPTGRPVPQQRARPIVESYGEAWATFGYGLLAVIHKETGELFGHCGLQPLDRKPSIELSFAITPPYTDTDLPYEAAYACLRYAFETLLMNEILAVVLPGNDAARRVYIRLGMRARGKVHAYDQYLPYFSLYQGDFIVDKSPYTLTGGTDDSPSA